MSTQTSVLAREKTSDMAVPTLKAGGRTSTDSNSGRHTRSPLVVAQVSLALMLLVCAGLMIRTLRNLNEVDAGFNSNTCLHSRCSRRNCSTTRQKSAQHSSSGYRINCQL